MSYGIRGLHLEEPIDEQLDFMAGLLPLDQSPLYLSCVKTEFGIPADIHIFPGDECDWVLLMDASKEEARATLLQQKTNELSLLRKKMLGIWSHIEDADGPEESSLEAFGLSNGVDYREVSVLRADIRGLDSYSRKQSPEQVFKTLEKYLAMSMVPITDAGGIVMSVLGASITAVFGVLPTVAAPADQSITAAIRIIGTVKDTNKVYRKNDLDTFEIKVGIASGPVALGFRSYENKSLNIVGYPVEQAIMLGYHASPFEIAVDSDTLGKIDLEAYRSKFSDIVPKSILSSSDVPPTVGL